MNLKKAETFDERRKRWQDERMIQIRQIDNGFLIEVRGEVGWTTLETYAARDAVGVVEIVAQLLRVDVEEKQC